MNLEKMHRRILLCCFVQILFIMSVEGVLMTVNPSSMVIGSANPGDTLELRCVSDGTDNIGIFNLVISRKRSADTEFVGILTLDVFVGIQKDKLPADIQAKSPNVTGGLVGTPPTSGSLILTMNVGGLTCSDQAEFKCVMSYKIATDTNTHTADHSSNFAVITAPNDVQITDSLYEDRGMLLQLANDSRLNVGTRITYRCRANIGGDPNVLITWERTSLLGTSTVFSTYTPTVSTDIVQDPVVNSSCSYTRTSTMYYNMTALDDDGVTFRCKVRAYIGNQWFETVSVHRRTFTISSGGNTGGNTSALSGTTSQAGVIAGAVIGAIAGVVLLIVLVYFLWYRRRSTGESYRTKEEGERPEPPPTDYTYATADKKNKDGYDNKGLEEPHEKTTRYPRSGRGGFDYRDGRNDGGHHNSGMDDEDGGTMHMSHGPIGTGV